MVAEWTAVLDIRLHNSDIDTYIRWQGEFIVELSWATQAAMNGITVWRVMDNVEALSDLLYINQLLHASKHTASNKGNVCTQRFIKQEG